MNYEQRTQSRLERAVQEILHRRRARTVQAEIRFTPMRDAMRRRAMVRSIDLAAKHYDLRQEVNAFLAERDCVSVAGLKDEDLSALSGWMNSTMDRLACACDHPDAPPAR